MNEQAIIAACREHGLEIAGVHFENSMLQLTPSDPTALSATDRFDELVAALRAMEPRPRWVTLVVETADD